MKSIVSADGTAISYERTGDGPPLVLVHGGAAGNHHDWQPVLPQLAEHFTVYAIDRRGRGESGDSTEYEIEREFEDIAVVVDSIDEPVVLLGHSFGALCSLEATLRAKNVEKLVLYEPAFPVEGGEILAEAALERIDRHLAEGDMEAALTTLFLEVGYSEEELELLRSKPWWPVGLSGANTITRELRALKAYHFDPARFADFSIPTALLTGSESPPLFRNTIETLHEGLPDSRVVTIPGQRHEAMTTAPDVFVEKVVQFSGRPAPSSSQPRE